MQGPRQRNPVLVATVGTCASTEVGASGQTRPSRAPEDHRGRAGPGRARSGDPLRPRPFHKPIDLLVMPPERYTLSTPIGLDPPEEFS